jgi:hypothetical protein
MAVHVDRDRKALFQAADQFERRIRRQQPGHVLDAQRMRAHVLDLLAERHPQVQRVHRAGGIGNRPLRVFAGGQHRFDGMLDIAQVVHCVENAEYVDAVDDAAFDEFVHHVVGVMAVAQDALAAQ